MRKRKLKWYQSKLLLCIITLTKFIINKKRFFMCCVLVDAAWGVWEDCCSYLAIYLLRSLPVLALLIMPGGVVTPALNQPARRLTQLSKSISHTLAKLDCHLQSLDGWPLPFLEYFESHSVGQYDGSKFEEYFSCQSVIAQINGKCPVNGFCHPDNLWEIMSFMLVNESGRIYFFIIDISILVFLMSM